MTFKDDLIKYLIELIEKDCYECKENEKPCSPDDKLYWLHHPVSYANNQEDEHEIVFDAARCETHIASGCGADWALVFDGNGLYDYITEIYMSEIFKFGEDRGYTVEPYHHWNLCFYKEK